MDYVELHRWFAPVRKDQEVNPDIGKLWGPKIHGWIDWEALRSYRRVVLLAEASSGKSEEFRHQARAIASEGHPAFFLRIEELADHGLEAALGPQESESFEIWKARASEGWFFLDSVDEARLNRKSFEGALKRFAREVGAALERTHIFVSCRVTDWKQADDRRAIMDWLPAWQTATVTEDRSEHSDLLDPIFNQSEQDKQSVAAHEVKPHELLVVQLVSLDHDQAVKFAKAAGVADTDAFDRELGRGGLEAFQQRPGDILELVAYWNEHKAFGSLDAMIDFGIAHKLSESDPFRADSDALSPAKARTGAELLAAALTLGKSFTLRAPGSETDPSLSAGAIDPAQVLDDWNNAERTSLLRRGIFAPATYGRIRFHHRSTQEFLTAKWFDRLLAENCPKAEIWNLIFADRYGVPTIVPSLRPAAAWLALWHPDIRDEIIRREPLVLLQEGAPRSLPIETRQRMLSLFAAKHAAGEISDTNLDSRNLAMFADERLSSSISQAWKLNDRDEFRFILLRLIRDGTIKGTIEIVRNVACDTDASDYQRTIAIQALAELDDEPRLLEFAKALMANAADLSASLAARAASALYPKAISTDDLLNLIARSHPPRSNSTEGFAYEVHALYVVATSRAEKAKLVGGLADLCLSPPFVQPYHRISERFGYLANLLRPIARAEILALNGEPSDGLVRLLMAVERADRHYPADDDLQEALVNVIGACEAGSPNTLDNAVAIVRKLELLPKQRERLFKNIHQRFGEHAASQADQFALRNLAVLFMLDASSALSALIDWVGKDRPEPGVTRVANVIATLFDGHHRSLAVSGLADLPLSGLEKLLSFTYKHIRPQDDYDHVGSYSPDTRDNAQTARNTILSQLLDRPGPDAYRSVLRLAEQPEFADRSERYRELAHSKAEKDSEFPAWTSGEVLTFERQHTAPTKTGADLLRVVMNVLADITFHLAKGDVSSRPLLQRAQDENEARNWIAEQMSWRAKGRFHVSRETEVAKRDRPDIVIASASAPCEVAIEVKHGDKGWTIANLEHALRSQLAEDYLKPESRRHGVLIVTNHSLRQWVDRSTRQRLSFEDLIARLSSIAKTILSNTSGAIEVRCVGIDAA